MEKDDPISQDLMDKLVNHKNVNYTLAVPACAHIHCLEV